MRLGIIILGFSMAVSQVSLAEGKMNRVQKRQMQQQTRIRHGIQSGELNRHEAQQLRREQRQNRKMKKQALADGEVSHEERRQLHQAQREASRNIYREKHDGEKKAGSAE